MNDQFIFTTVSVDENPKLYHGIVAEELEDNVEQLIPDGNNNQWWERVKISNIVGPISIDVNFEYEIKALSIASNCIAVVENLELQGEEKEQTEYLYQWSYDQIKNSEEGSEIKITS